MNTHEYTATLLSCLDREVKRGLLHLSNRGLLPPRADITGALTGQSNVLHAQAVHLLPHEHKFIASSSAPEAAKEYGVYARLGARRYKANQEGNATTAGNTGMQFPAANNGERESSDGCSSADDCGSGIGSAPRGLGNRNGHLSPGRNGRTAPSANAAARPPRGPSAAHSRSGHGEADPAIVTRLVADASLDSDSAGCLDEAATPGAPQDASTSQVHTRHHVRDVEVAMRAGQGSSVSIQDSSAAGPPVSMASASLLSGVGSGASVGHGGRGAPHAHHTGGRAAPLSPAGNGVAAGGDGAEAREYEDLMDDLAVHSVIIRKGQVLDATPEYESFQRTCGGAWPAVAAVLVQLEAICVQYAVPLATVAGRRVLELGEEAAEAAAAAGGARPPPPLSIERLLACIENIQEVAAVLQRPGQRFRGPNGPAAAVVVIQAFMRGLHARRVRNPPPLPPISQGDSP